MKATMIVKHPYGGVRNTTDIDPINNPPVRMCCHSSTDKGRDPEIRKEMAAPNIPTRARVRHFAMEVEASDVTSIGDLQNLREDDFDPALSDAQAAGLIGLTLNAGVFDNAQIPASELCMPDSDTAVALQNRNSDDLGVKLWCFDHRGRPLDAGSVAALWAHMATPALWDNLWAHSDADDQRTADVADGLLVHLVSAHEGPLSAEIDARLNLSDLNMIGIDSQLYGTGAAPSIGLTNAADPDTDTVPLPRLAWMPAEAPTIESAVSSMNWKPCVGE